jgi:dihydroorotate dehydrogenase
MYGLVRPLLFRADPERVHNATLQLLRMAGRLPPVRGLLARLFRVDDSRLEVEVFGVRFRNPVGLAAGYDKNGVALRGLASLGFGHLEVGTLTPQPQAGNPRPRVHRFPAAQALVNSMGFPNAGIESLPPGLAAVGRTTGTRVGINLGKGRDTPLERAADDYRALLRHVHAHQQADYVAINISSPNTKDLRRLQQGAAVGDLLGAVASERNGLSPRLPLLVKIAPDLSEPEIDAILDAVLAAGLDGVIATNTTTSRDLIPQARDLPGGTSGEPVRERSTAIVRHIAARTEGRLPIIGVGGILRPAEALDKIEAGAWLVQLYTGLVYTGPGLVHAINIELLRACASAGAAHVGALRRTVQPAPGGSYAPR